MAEWNYPGPEYYEQILKQHEYAKLKQSTLIACFKSYD